MQIQRRPLRFPRTAAEAFPRTCDYACPIQRPRSAWRPLNRLEWVSVACLVALGLLPVVLNLP